jgi:hypothetical protein
VYSSYAAERPGIVFMPAVDLAIYTNPHRPPGRRADSPAAGRRGPVGRDAARTSGRILRPTNWAQVKELRRRNGEVWRLFVVK